MGKWEMVRLGDVCVIERGGSPRPIDKFITEEDNGINWIKIGDTSPNSMYITATKEKIKPEGVKKSRRVYSGDFLLSNSMSFGRPYILKIDGCIHDGWLLIRDERKVFDKRFLYYYLGSDKTYSEFKGLAVGGVVNNLNSGVVRNLTIPLPSLPVQQQIADALDRASTLVEKRKAQIDKLDLLVKSQFVEMFGDPVTNPKGWEKDRLGDIADVGSSKRVFVEELVDEGIPFYRGTEIGAMATGDTILPTLFITQEHYERLRDATGVPQIGDLLMPSICPDGRIWRVNTNSPFYFKDGRVLWVHFTETTFNDTYLLYALKERIIADYSSIASGTTFAELKIFSLKNVCVLMPPAKLQKQFADFVHQAEAQKSLLQQSLAKLEQNYKSLMQKCFRGEIF